jgi:large conductance mechanosensitive channel
MWKEFQEFAVKGNVVDMAVGIIIGGAFGTIVSSLVNDIVMPPIGYLIGGVDFTGIMTVLVGEGPFATPEAAAAAGAVTVNWGLFINSIISFLIIAWALFFVIRMINRMKRRFDEAPVEQKPAPPPRQEVLLEDIRNLLAARAQS